MANTKFQSLPAEQQAAVRNAFARRFEVLREIAIKADEAALRYLFLTNAGGAATVLGFIGTSESARLSAAPRIALSCFVAGLVLDGVLLAGRLHRFENFLTKYNDDTLKCVQGNITVEEAHDRDLQRTTSKSANWLYAIGYLSFAAFIAGVAIGGWSLSQ